MGKAARAATATKAMTSLSSTHLVGTRRSDAAISEPTIALPAIHHNGTGAETLLREYETLCSALSGAILALENATCNPRDFYVQGEGAWERARAERTLMFEKLREVQNYANAWAERASDSIGS